MTKTAERIHDEALTVLMRRAGDARYRFEGTLDSLRCATKVKGLSMAEAVERVREMIAECEMPWRVTELERIIERAETAAAALREALTAIKDHEVGYTGWVRFFLLTSSDGHIHRSMACHTCNKGRNASTFALMPMLSGTSIEAAVAALGPALCSVCFPEAPVEMVDALKIPARLATVLFDKGEDAFWSAKAEHEAKAAKRAAERCPGTGAVVAYDRRLYRPWGHCPECGEGIGIRHGRLVAHKGGAK